MGLAETHAIIIGNNATPIEDVTLAPLRFADDDAVRYLSLFERIADQTHLLTVLDADTQRRHPGLASRSQPPTLKQLRKVLIRIKDRMRTEPGVLYLVFSGHGGFDKQGLPFLALLDTGLTQSILFDEIIRDFPARRIHLIIDACNAGAVLGARGTFDRETDAPAVPVSPQTQAAVLHQGSLARFPHVGALLATSAGQQSHEWSRIKSGVFTHELLSGAVGAADINGDLRIEYSELQAFISAANSQVSDPRARPNVIAVPPAEDQRAPLFSLADLGGPFLRGPAGQLSRFHIELASGQRYLDAHFGKNDGFTILLPKDTAGFIRTKNREAAFSAQTDGIVHIEDLSFRTVQLAGRGSLDLALRQQLFLAPFDVAYYRGYVDSRALVPADLNLERADPLKPAWIWKEKAAVGLFAGAVAALVSSTITGGLALRTKRQHDETTIQRTAAELAQRYDTLVTATWLSGAFAVAAAGTGTWLWYSAQPADASTQSLVLGLGGRF